LETKAQQEWTQNKLASAQRFQLAEAWLQEPGNKTRYLFILTRIGKRYKASMPASNNAGKSQGHILVQKCENYK
jgi:hypothetical protein